MRARQPARPEGGLQLWRNDGALRHAYEIKPARIQPGKYRNITGNTALAMGLVVAGHQTGRPLFLGSYPITPASDILHELATYKNFGVITFQAEDEIAGVGAALGAAFGGAIALTTTSGPGMCLKAETINLAVSVELPLVIGDIQRGGPSTGPADEDGAGRSADGAVRPQQRLAGADHCASTPADCFWAALRSRAHRHQVHDAGHHPVGWLPRQWRRAVAHPEGRRSAGAHGPSSAPSRRASIPTCATKTTLSRPWVVPGTPGLEHRIGGLEKEYLSGNVSYAPANHEQMVRVRARKIAGIAADILDLPRSMSQ